LYGDNGALLAFYYAFLIENNFNTKVNNSIKSEAFRKMHICQTKNDSKDSFISSQIMLFGQCAETKLFEEGSLMLHIHWRIKVLEEKHGIIDHA